MSSNKLTWPHAAVLCAKVQLGLGIWGIPMTLHTLGLVPGILCLLALSFTVVYAGVLTTSLRHAHPDVRTLADVGFLLFGRTGGAAVTCLFWTVFVLIVGAGLLATSIALNAVSTHVMCTASFLALAAAFAFLVGAPLRRLRVLSWLGWCGLACIVISVYVLVVSLLVKQASRHTVVTRDRIWHGKAGFDASMCALGVQFNALMGNVAFYNISAEMRRPAHFTRAVAVGQAFVTFNYLVIGLVVSVATDLNTSTSPALSAAGPLIKVVCYAIALPGLVVSTLVFANVAAKCLEKGVERMFEKANAWFVWLISYSLVILLGYVTASTIPVFDSLMGMIGASAGPFFILISTGFVQLYLHVYHFRRAQKGRSSDHFWISDLWSSLRASSTSRQRTFACLLSIVMIVFGLFLTFGGMYGSVRDILHVVQKRHADPFSCLDNSI